MKAFYSGISLTFPSSVYADGLYQLRVFAYDTSNYLVNESDSVGIEINNTAAHTLGFASFLTPGINQSVSGDLNITWNPAIDSQGHLVFYNLSLKMEFSPFTEFTLINNLATGNIYSLDTSIFAGGQYTLFLTAFDNIDQVKVSSRPMIIDHTLSFASFLTPSFNETIDGNSLYNITWIPAIDSQGHFVFYNLSLRMIFFPFTEFILVTNLVTGTSFSLNTSLYADDQYTLFLTAFDNIEHVKISSRPVIIGTVTHSIAVGSFIAPTLNNQSLSGLFNASWNPYIDSLGHTVYYNVSMDMQVPPFTSFVLTTGTTNTGFSFNTFLYPDASTYRLIVVAYDTFGQVVTGFIDFNIFTNGTQNVTHTLDPSFITFPLNNSRLSGNVNVTWTESFDSLGHTLLYNLTMQSSISPFTFYDVSPWQGAHNYAMNTTEYPNGNYSLTIIVFDGFGLMESRSISIMINNGVIQPPLLHTISTPELISHSNNDQISGIIKIEYNASVDSFGHSLRYNITIKSSNGTIVYTTVTNNINDLIDTTVVENGIYEITVFAFDDFGLTSATFKISVLVGNVVTVTDKTSTSSGNLFDPNASPGFELLFVIFGFGAMVLLRKRIST